MKANKLIGKLAIRKKPVTLGRNDFTEEYNYDYSYTSEPIKILKVTDEHIIYSHKDTNQENIFGDEVSILDNRWNDDNWIDYEELIKIEQDQKNES